MPALESDTTPQLLPLTASILMDNKSRSQSLVNINRLQRQHVEHLELELNGIDENAKLDEALRRRGSLTHETVGNYHNKQKQK